MCDKCCCSNPEIRMDKSENCTAEQIEECHPESDGHPCEVEGKDQQEEQSECEA